MKLAAFNLGCPKNCVDLEELLGAMQNHDIAIVEDISEADIAIVNTCAFIQPAIEESLETIFELHEFKRSGLHKLIVTGCLPQRYGMEIHKDLPEVDLFITSRNIYKIKEILLNNLGIAYTRLRSGYHQLTPRHYAYVKISEGCDNRCAYCTIPNIKGNYRSYGKNEILKQVRDRTRNGTREIILVGQDTTRYGADLECGEDLASLIGSITKEPSVHWLRLMYAHPAHFAPDLVQLFAENGKICRYIDIPIQHASDRILRAMGRNTTKDGLFELFSTLRDSVPHLALRSTVLVGFPGETEAEFQELLDFLEAVQFDRFGVFSYWREEGTPAYELPGQLSSEEKQRRHAEVLDLQARISYEKNNALIGHRMEIIIDGYDAEKNKYIGRTEWDCPEIDNVFYVDGEMHIGEFYHAIVVDTDGFDLYGII